MKKVLIVGISFNGLVHQTAKRHLAKILNQYFTVGGYEAKPTVSSLNGCYKHLLLDSKSVDLVAYKFEAIKALTAVAEKFDNVRIDFYELPESFYVAHKISGSQRFVLKKLVADYEVIYKKSALVETVGDWL